VHIRVDIKIHSSKARRREHGVAHSKLLQDDIQISSLLFIELPDVNIKNLPFFVIEMREGKREGGSGKMIAINRRKCQW
jgi:hypothetical protein